MNSLRKILTTARMEAITVAGENGLFLADYALRLLRVVVFLSLWRLILGDRGAFAGMTLATTLTYTLIAEAFRDLFDARTDLQGSLWNGSIATRMTQPMGVFTQYASRASGRWTMNFALFSLPLLVLAPLLGVNPLPASPVVIPVFALSVVLAVATGLALELSFFSFAVLWSDNTYGLDNARLAATALLSGVAIPLEFLPWGIGQMIEWLPFAATASAPLKIYIGTGDTVRLLALQAGWAAAFWLMAHWLWSVSREKFVSYGG